ncbi:MAG: vitamin K epoxide reductase family protein [Cyanobacteriota bacterium]|nr:vitamin K epoxide reductase family protein [Cyanobacteriota bacterium]
MIRRRSTPWIHRWSRPIMGSIAIIGALGTAFLTVVKLRGDISGVCAGGGCDVVLSSPYASIFGLPLTLFGFLGYAAMATFAFAPLVVSPEKNKKLHLQLERWTGLFLFLGGTAMVVFSSYLMYILASELKTTCLYCITSATFSLSLFVLSIIGRAWDDIGQLLFSGIAVAMVTLVGTLGVYAGINGTSATASAPANIELAKHLGNTDAKMFGAYWCGHCQDQKDLFGKQAFKDVEYVECAEDGENSQTQLCRSEGIQAFPTWKINGELHSGVQSLEELADLSNYEGSRDFGS